MKSNFINIHPVLPSQDITRDIKWYKKYTGFDVTYADDMYAVLKRDNIYFHLQWHADTKDDPLLGGSVIKIFVNDIQSIATEFIQRQTITNDKINLHTAWNTNEFGFYDLNNNAIFFVEDL